jgi:Response regulator containing a CheY-like receiver domain and an HTH DNA-binding domain
LNLIDEKKYSELEHRASQLKDDATMVEFLFLMREAYSLQHVFFSVLSKTSGTFSKTYGTYPDEWRELYIEHNLAAVDPVLRHASSQTPILWEMIDSLTPEERAVMETREKHGIGPHGLTIPLISSDGHTSLLSITGKADMDPDRNWRKRANVMVREFREIGMIMHAAYLRQNGQHPPKVELSARHVDCIRMIGHGMSIEQLAAFQGLSQRSAKQYMAEARKRLRARNNAQLIYNAIQLGFIEM